MRRLHNAELFHGANSMGLSVPASPSGDPGRFPARVSTDEDDAALDPTFLRQNDAVDSDLALDVDVDVDAEQERLFRSVPPVRSRDRESSPEYFSDLDAAPASRRKKPRVDLRLGQSRVRIPGLGRDEPGLGPIQQEDGGPGPDYYSPQWMDNQQERQQILSEHPDYKFLSLVSGFANRPATEMYDFTGFLGEQRRDQFLRRQQEERLRQTRTDLEQMTRRRRRLAEEIRNLRSSLEDLRSDVALADVLIRGDGETARDLAHDEEFLASLEKRVKFLETVAMQGGTRPGNFHRDNHDTLIDMIVGERQHLLEEHEEHPEIRDPAGRGLSILAADLIPERSTEDEGLITTTDRARTVHAEDVHTALVRWWLVEFQVEISSLGPNPKLDDLLEYDNAAAYRLTRVQLEEQRTKVDQAVLDRLETYRRVLNFLIRRKAVSVPSGLIDQLREETPTAVDRLRMLERAGNIFRKLDERASPWIMHVAREDIRKLKDRRNREAEKELAMKKSAEELMRGKTGEELAVRKRAEEERRRRVEAKKKTVLISQELTRSVSRSLSEEIPALAERLSVSTRDMQSMEKRISELRRLGEGPLDMSKLDVVYPYRHSVPWLQRPENSGLVIVRSTVVAAVAEAFRKVERFARLVLPSRIRDSDNRSLELLQRHPKVSSAFAKIVALELALADITHPTQYHGRHKFALVEHQQVDQINRLKGLAWRKKHGENGGYALTRIDRSGWPDPESV